MKILVPLKRVPDPDTKIRVKPDGSGIETDGVKFAVNPFDSIALEEALRLREKTGAAEIVVVTIGGEECGEQLRTGLAMGADRAILVKSAAALDSLAVAKVLAAVCQKEQPSFVIMGKQAIDDDSNQAGQMLAALLGLGQATFVSKLELTDGHQRARCSRETDAGIEHVAISLPAVFTADLRLNEPRYVSLPGIMKARKKPLEELSPEALGVSAASRTRVLKVERPAGRKAGVRVKSVDELIARLRTEAKVL
ncbi:MAG: electron transfer flavoprotein subunit beta/FixA family protein [Opitutae bacterium]|nr:electron transfer flavoprotein subunit beta/FixA family protein [Opitutae bacterium]